MGRGPDASDHRAHRRAAGAAGRPAARLPVIHITGTNGKTSTARMIDALLRALGLRTGRYTSPHWSDHRAHRRRRRADRAPTSSRPTTRSRPTSRWSTASFDIRLSFFEVVDRDGLRGLRRRAGGRRGGRGGAGRLAGTPPTWSTPRSRSSPRSTSTTPSCSATRSRRSPRRRPASSSPARSADPAPRSRRSAAEPLLRRAVEVGATVAREGAGVRRVAP